jgi:hypothetical protein
MEMEIGFKIETNDNDKIRNDLKIMMLVNEIKDVIETKSFNTKMKVLTTSQTICDRG